LTQPLAVESPIGVLDVFDEYISVLHQHLYPINKSITTSNSPSHIPPKPPHAAHLTPSNRNNHFPQQNRGEEVGVASEEVKDESQEESEQSKKDVATHLKLK
jgi:hypothetical protein